MGWGLQMRHGVIPVNTVAPSIIGGSTPPVVGETLVVNIGTWTGIPTPDFTYQWRAGVDGTTDIVGATNPSHTLETTEEGDLITIVVTGDNAQGSNIGTSASVGAVVASGDLTAPVLSNFVATPVDETLASLSVDTTKDNGIVSFVIVPTAATAPDATEIQAGTDGVGNPATWADSLDVSDLAMLEAGPSGLTVETTYDAYSVHVDELLNVSNIVTAEFTTGSNVVIFHPSMLFASAELGGLYAPSEPDTFYQSSKGVVPVTTDAQTVGLALDQRTWAEQSFSDVIAGQANLAPGGGTFDSDIGYTLPAGHSISGGKFVLTSSAANLSTLCNTDMVSGRHYRITFTIDSISGQVRVRAGSAGDTGLDITSPGTYHTILKASGDGDVQITARSAGVNAQIDNLIVKEVPGYHLLQATAGALPVINIAGALYNLDFDGVDDALSVTFPGMGATCTVAYVTSAGVTILTGQSISGAYTAPTADWYALVIINRALTVDETADLTAWLLEEAGL